MQHSCRFEPNSYATASTHAYDALILYIYIDIYGLPPTEIHKIAAWCLPRFAEQRPCLSAGKAGFFLGGSFRVQGISACFRSCRLYWGSSSKAFRSRWLFCCLDFGIHMRSDSSTRACKLSTSTCIWTLIPVILKTWFFKKNRVFRGNPKFFG